MFIFINPLHNAFVVPERMAYLKVWMISFLLKLKIMVLIRINVFEYALTLD